MQVASGGKRQLATGTPNLTNHVILCGHGRVGKSIARFLSQLAIPYVVTDLDPKTVSELRERGVSCVYGDAGNPNVLYEAGIKDARVLVLAIADPVAVRLALDHAQRINPSLDIIARAHSSSEFEFLQKRGVPEVIRPEIEAGIEITRHILYQLKVPVATIEDILSSQRKIYPM